MIQAAVTWKRGEDAFLDNKYHRRHQWAFDGGLEIPASSSPDVVPAPLSDPAAVDPEEAFVASISSCHMLWFLSLAARRGWVVDEYVDRATGKMGKNDDGQIAVTVVTLHPKIHFGGSERPDEQEISALHHQAHEKCFIANSVRSEVRCEPVTD